MTWPDSDQIKAAIVTPTNILDRYTTAHHYQCLTRQKRGQVRPLSSEGGFCVAFKFANDGGDKLCYRVWKTEPKRDMQQRLKLISDFLKQHPQLNYFVDFSFLGEALRMPGGMSVPGVRMAWVEGQSLGAFIKDHARQPELMRRLAEQFRQMCETFRQLGIAHGDLSNENIVIDSGGRIRLVDYDSVYVPQMGDNYFQTTGGFSSFQHPWRVAHSARLKASARDDNFSQQVIYLSLLAVAQKPEIADLFGDKDLLFNANDYESERAFTDSRGYQKVSTIADAEVRRRLAELRRSLAADYAAVRSICDPIPSVKVVEYAKFCSKCGQPYLPNAAFCLRCGHKRDIVKNYTV